MVIHRLGDDPAMTAAHLRIGILVDQFPELSETFIAAELHELERQGHHVHVEAAGHAPNPNAALAEGLSVAYISDDGRRENLRAIAWLAARHPLRAIGDLLARRRWRREEEVAPLRRLAPAARRLSEFGAQHLHAHFAAGAALHALRLARLLGVPYSVMTHGYDIFQLPSNLAEKHARAAFALSACDYSVEYVRERIDPRDRERVQRLVVGVDGARFARSGAHASSGIVLSVGRIVEKKGLRHLIDAAALLRDDPAFERVMIVGEGPLRGELEEHAERVGARVELLGARTPDEVHELLEQAAVVAVPAVVAADGDRDTMPVIAKEALAMEVPVVASDTVGLPEVVRPEWGTLVPPGDPAALAAALAELLRLPLEVRAAMGRAGRAFVLSECSLERETARLAELIAASART
jgi:glycosyltransferase involved in cell wall biosynthesis